MGDSLLGFVGILRMLGMILFLVILLIMRRL